ncbi:MAG: hypothetical protein UT43_C0017G0007 [Parcubacteria group bacterium GW2011_GWC1_39_29]|uniref:Uncharacterized protein n=1 Tax=Candidatus Yanofskybacteria bacterium GW2011_GWD1_39_16 TaxID=1619030 RepID=A0A837HQ11_9BACT|nr:MAG: hypothetical protein UT35_C0002G0006 [Candidatus Yanofskybacteria bacterium GW2011_GWD1_39_16]KKR14736.1 MAG: hypothetical protein UT43_C0017G0007 [Parcubacteria group bacterium GW2011_GWC1_39_29]
MNVAKLMTWIVWGDTKGWIDPEYRNLNRSENDLLIEQGMRDQQNREVNKLRELLAKK